MEQKKATMLQSKIPTGPPLKESATAANYIFCALFLDTVHDVSELHVREICIAARAFLQNVLCRGERRLWFFVAAPLYREVVVFEGFFGDIAFYEYRKKICRPIAALCHTKLMIRRKGADTAQRI